MTAPTQDEVNAVLTAVTPYSLPADPAGTILYNMAITVTTPIFKNRDHDTWTLAAAYYIANMLYLRGTNGAILTAEHLDDHSESFAIDTNFASPWAKLYNDLVMAVSSFNYGAFIGVTKDDCVDRYNLDTNTVRGCHGCKRF